MGMPSQFLTNITRFQKREPFFALLWMSETMTLTDIGGILVISTIVIYVCISGCFPCSYDDDNSQSQTTATTRKPDKNAIDSELVIEIWNPETSTTTTKEKGEQLKEDDIEKGNGKVILKRNDSTISSSVHIDEGSAVDDDDGSCDDDVVCSICLDSFHNGDFVGRSSNPKCIHAFHRDCIVGWLITRNECPICRQTFLILPAPNS